MLRLSKSDAKSVLDELQYADEDWTLCVRSLIQASAAGLLPGSKVFVNRERAAVLCHFDIAAWAEEEKGLFAGLHAENPKALTEALDTAFLDKPPTTVLVLDANFQEAARAYFEAKGKEVWVWGPYAVFVSETPDESVLTSTKCGPGGRFELSTLRPEEAQEVSMDHDRRAEFPEHGRFFGWLSEVFPQLEACIRNEKKVPVAWVLELPFGAAASQFTVPEHRRKGLAKLLRSALGTLHQISGSPVPAFAAVEAGNAEETALNVALAKRPSNSSLVWIIARDPDPPSEEEQEEIDEPNA